MPMLLKIDRTIIIVATLTVTVLGVAFVMAQSIIVTYIAMGFSGGFALLSAALLHYQQRRLAKYRYFVSGSDSLQSKPEYTALGRIHVPWLLLLWLFLIGLAIPESLTFGSRTSGSDYILPLLFLLIIGWVRKDNITIIPPRAKPWMVLTLLWHALALVHGALRVGSMTISIVLSSLMGLVIGYTIVCVVYSTLSDIESMQQSILIFIVAGSIWNLISLGNYTISGWNGRLAGTLLNPNAYAMFISVVWVCQLIYLTLARNNRWRFFLVLNLLPLSAGLVFSASRGAWLSCLLVLVLMISFFANTGARVRIAVMATFLLVAGWLLYPWIDSQGWLNPVWERFNYERGVESRFITDEFALGLWYSSPFTVLVGIGIGVYRQLYAYFTVGAAGSLHNTYVAFLVEQGMVGFLAWFAVILIAISGLWRVRRLLPDTQKWVVSAAALSIIALLVQGVAHDISNQRSLWFFIGLALAIGDKLQIATLPRIH